MLRLTLLFIAICATVLAQFRAGVEGLVTDSTGSAVPNATVTLTENATQKSVKVQTSGEGFYSFSGLSPGTYTLTAEKAGFRRESLTSVIVSAEEVQGRNLSLQPGEVAQSVTVSDTANSLLETENADVGKSITSEEVQNLPQIGRDPYELLRITPGVFGDGARNGGGSSVALPNTTGSGGSNYSIFQTENQVPIVANGQRLSENNYQVDGVSVNSLGWGGAAVVTPNQESVEQIRVTSSAYAADVGRNAGAQIEVVSKSGTNQLHGSGVFKYDDPNFNAFNSYGGYDLPPARVNQLYRQYAMSIGGPVIKNHLFYFFSYEGLRNKSVNYVNQWIETSQFRQAVLSLRPNSFAAEALGAPGQAPRVVSIANLPCPSNFAPGTCQQVPGGLDIGSITGGTGAYTSLAGAGLDGIPDLAYAELASPSSISANQYNGRVDYTHGKDSIALSMYFTALDQVGASDSQADRPIADLPFTPLNTAVTLTYTRILTPNLINEARANLTRFASNQLAAASNADFRVPDVKVEGLPTIPAFYFGAPQSNDTPSILAQNTYEARDRISWVHANHALKAGVEIRREQDNNNLLGGARPLFSFSGLWNLANSAPLFEQVNANPNTGGPADAQRYFRTGDYAAFVQDDWKVSRTLTLNLGLRWEYFVPLREKYNDLTNLQFGPHFLQDATVVPVGELYHADRHSFAPRFGFAWNPDSFHKNVVVRGGFGMFFNRIYENLLANVAANPPNFAVYQICCGNTGAPFDNGKIQLGFGATNSPLSYSANLALAQGINPATGAPNSGSVEIYGAPDNLPNSYAYIYSFEVQTNLPGQLVATAGYQGSTDHKLIRLVNQNFLYPNNPAFSAIYFPTPDVNSNYNALVVNIARRFANGIQLNANYRWSKSMDNLSYAGPGSVTNQTYPQDNSTERGPSDFDTTHNFLLSGTWELPLFRGQHNLVGKIFGGLSVSTMLQAHSGFPWTPVIGQSIDTPGGATLAPTRPIAYFGGGGHSESVNAFETGSNFPLGGSAYFDTADSGFPGIGRNSWRGPRYFATDFSFAKNVRLPNRYLGEATDFDIRCNMFNAFNTLNLTPITFGDNAAHADMPQFGRADAGLAGRVVELQFRLSF
ncbi:MAG TPA: carboxypeptidase regulatory-like domain-containing protein [Bryobacteraceae bacterium]|nr:carboxypeptidase regulatory-like domain-containing protein [Bryobacteraceae bacterium]